MRLRYEGIAEEDDTRAGERHTGQIRNHREHDTLRGILIVGKARHFEHIAGTGARDGRRKKKNDSGDESANDVERPPAEARVAGPVKSA